MERIGTPWWCRLDAHLSGGWSTSEDSNSVVGEHLEGLEEALGQLHLLEGKTEVVLAIGVH